MAALPRPTVLLVPALFLAALLLAACGAQAGGSTASPASPAPSAASVRLDLGNTLPTTASGQRLGLWYVSIPAGQSLVAHVHPGWQIARVVAGTLTYTIITGKATVIRANGASETHGAGETITIATGDTIVENPDLQHYGANNGTQTVEIYASSLFTDGQPAAIALPSASPAASR